MTRPDRRQQAALSAAFAGAVDLSGLGQRPAAPAAGEVEAESSPHVVTVTETNLAEVVQTSTQVPVVFDLWSPRSQISAQLSALLVKQASASGGTWTLARVDVDQNPRIAQALGVQQIPTVMAVAAGQPVADLPVPFGEQDLSAWITALLDALRDRLPGIRAAEAENGTEVAEVPADPRFTAAEELLDQGDYAGAQAAYQHILDTEPGNAQAQAALAQTALLARVESHPTDAVAAADADPADVDLQRAAADVEVAEGRPEAAFTRLVDAVRRTGGDERSSLREHLVALFALFPADDEVVRAARRALAAALY